MAKRSAADRELAALGAIMNALDGLDGESIQRVLDYVFSRLSIVVPNRVSQLTGPISAHVPAENIPETPRDRTSIRDLKEEKQPHSSNQMAALVAYYLTEVAEPGERKDTINAADISRYFKQAGFKLPRATRSALPNAAAAGYFEPVGDGQYKLNAVGYNLVVHGLPRGADTGKRRGRTRQRTASKPKPRKTSRRA
jgi:hypothetical protein